MTDEPRDDGPGARARLPFPGMNENSLALPVIGLYSEWPDHHTCPTCSHESAVHETQFMDQGTYYYLDPKDPSRGSYDVRVHWQAIRCTICETWCGRSLES